VLPEKRIVEPQAFFASGICGFMGSGEFVRRSREPLFDKYGQGVEPVWVSNGTLIFPGSVEPVFVSEQINIPSGFGGLVLDGAFIQPQLYAPVANCLFVNPSVVIWDPLDPVFVRMYFQANGVLQLRAYDDFGGLTVWLRDGKTWGVKTVVDIDPFTQDMEFFDKPLSDPVRFDYLPTPWSQFWLGQGNEQEFGLTGFPIVKRV